MAALRWPIQAIRWQQLTGPRHSHCSIADVWWLGGAMRLKTIPKFSSETAARRFWEKTDSTACVDWKQAERATLANLKPSTQTISRRLPQLLTDW
jgi:CopG antitoxin of type II toxin-antitoxin system